MNSTIYFLPICKTTQNCTGLNAQGLDCNIQPDTMVITLQIAISSIFECLLSSTLLYLLIPTIAQISKCVL